MTHTKENTISDEQFEQAANFWIGYATLLVQRQQTEIQRAISITAYPPMPDREEFHRATEVLTIAAELVKLDPTAITDFTHDTSFSVQEFAKADVVIKRIAIQRNIQKESESEPAQGYDSVRACEVLQSMGQTERNSLPPIIVRPGYSYTKDFSTVRWGMHTLDFSRSDGRRRVMGFLICAYERSPAHPVSKDTIADEIGESPKKFRMDELFRDHPVWTKGIIIHDKEGGGYRLDSPQDHHK